MSAVKGAVKVNFELDLGRFEYAFFEQAALRRREIERAYESIYARFMTWASDIPPLHIDRHGEDGANTLRFALDLDPSHRSPEAIIDSSSTSLQNSSEVAMSPPLGGVGSTIEGTMESTMESTMAGIKGGMQPPPSLEGLSHPLYSRVEEDGKSQIEQFLFLLRPWRKGPYHFPGFTIDSEWDSSIKWQRLKDILLASARGKRVIDIGAHNGYFMLQLLQAEPEWILGLDPLHRAVVQYDCLRFLLHTGGDAVDLQRQCLQPLGVEALMYFDKQVDLILLLGILYHHRDPLTILERVYAALCRKGRVIIDCAGLPGDEALALFPERRYTGKRGFYFIPTKRVLIAWLRRTGFREIHVLAEETLNKDEQRRSPWADTSSLCEGLMPDDTDKEKLQTIEGYPPPMRYYICAEK